ncbi:MAG: hypothetical protein ACOYKI_01655 [Sediminibacterium sp.]|jgi:hypothetical protein
MNNKLKIFLFFCLIVISYHSISQEQRNNPREVKEIKLIMNDIFNNKIYTGDFYFKEGTYILPSYFNSYIDYYKMLKNYKISTDFVASKRFNLNKKDCDQLNYSILNDTAKVYIKKDWFTGVNVKIISDSVTKFQKDTYTNYIKPIFFRNNTRCFIAIYHNSYLNAFFLKKKFNNWELDKLYITLTVD